MQNRLYLETELSKPHLQKTLEALIERHLKDLNLPESDKEKILENKAQIAEKLAEGLQNKGLKLDDFGYNDFRQKFLKVLEVSMIIGKNDKLMQYLDRIKPDPENKEKEKNSDEFKKEFSDQELKEMVDDLNQSIKEIRNQPGQKADTSKEKVEEEENKETLRVKKKEEKEEIAEKDREAIINLFGIYSAGGFTGVVYMFIGNYAAFPDQHAGDSLNQIDQVNRVDKSKGDPLGLEAGTEANYLSAGSEYDSDFASDLLTDVNKLISTPTLTPPQG